MKVVAVTQARIGSSRLPGKVLQQVCGKSLLQVHLQRLSQAAKVEHIIVATTKEPDAYKIKDIAGSLGLGCFEGSLEDVLDRFYQAVSTGPTPEYVVRVTSDCPLLDPTVIDETITFAIENGFDYASNCLERTYPDGLDVEIFTFKALEIAWRNAQLASEREHVTPYIWKNCDVKGGGMFRGGNLGLEEDFSRFRLTVDEPADLDLIRNLIGALGAERPWREYTDYLTAHPALLSTNRHIHANEGYRRSLRRETGPGEFGQTPQAD